MKPIDSFSPHARPQRNRLLPLGGALVLAVATLLSGGLVVDTIEAREADERLCISLNRAVAVAEGHRANGAEVTMLSERGEVDRWYEVVVASAGIEPVDKPDLIIVISYGLVTYAHIANGGSVCDGAQMPSGVAREAMEAARGAV